jgi:hypothetical protein
MCSIRLDIAEKQSRVFHMYRREHRHQLSFEDFFLPFGGGRVPLREVGAFYWTVPPPDIVNPGREEQGSSSV